MTVDVEFIGENERACFVISDTISPFIFKRILGSFSFSFYSFCLILISFFGQEFLYTGTCNISGPADFVEETNKAAQLFLCEELSTMCANITQVFFIFFQINFFFQNFKS